MIERQPATSRPDRDAAARALLGPAPAPPTTTLPFGRAENDHDRADLARLRTLVASLQAGVLVEDERGRIVLVNDELCRLLGVGGADLLIGADCLAAVTETLPASADASAFRQRVADVLAAREPVREEPVALRDGRCYERDYLPIWSDQQYGGHLWVYRDVTGRVAAEAELQHARDEALRAASAKAEFLATMSHEIRTPMNGIVATLELLDRTGLGAEQRELLGIVEESAGTLRTLLDDVLDVSRLDAGAVELERVPVDVARLVERTVALSRAQASERGIGLDVDVARGLPCCVADPARLRQVLHNLISNAVKFTERGGVTVRVGVAPSRDLASVSLLLEVADTGIGVPEGELERIFERFAQADASTTRRYGGTGLGLAIVQRLVERMEGTIDVASQVGVGTRVTVWLPLAVVGAVDQAPVPASEPEALVGRVLLAEDLDLNRAVILRQLARLGIEADAVADGAQAVAAIRAGDYALVLMDCRMPVLDGFDATRAIRRLAGPASATPIVALTANAIEGDRETCLAAGMDGYLSKPLTLANLHEGLKPYLGAATGSGPSPRRDSMPPAAGTALARPATLQRLAGELGSRDVVDELVGAFLDELDARVEAVTGAVGDLHALAEAAHALKTPSAMFGAEALAGRCAAIERAARAGEDPAALIEGFGELAWSTAAALRCAEPQARSASRR